MTSSLQIQLLLSSSETGLAAKSNNTVTYNTIINSTNKRAGKNGFSLKTPANLNGLVQQAKLNEDLWNNVPTLNYIF